MKERLDLDQMRHQLREHYHTQSEATAQRSKLAAEQRLAIARESLSTNDTDPNRHFELATCFENLNRYAEALSVLETALRRCPRTADLYHQSIKLLTRCNRAEQ